MTLKSSLFFSILRGLDANKTYEDKGTLLHMAAIAGLQEVIKILLEPGSERAYDSKEVWYSCLSSSTSGTPEY